MKRVIISFCFFSCILQAHDLYVLVSHGFGSHGSTTKFLLKMIYPSTVCYNERECLQMDDCWRFQDYDLFKRVYAAEFKDGGELWDSYLGAGQDLEILQSLFHKKIVGHQFVGIGPSRGGAALLSWIGCKNPRGLKGIVLIDSVASIPKVAAYRIGGYIGSEFIATVQLGIRTSYPIFTKTPLEWVDSIVDKNMLIVLINHLHDRTVPNEHSKWLYEEFYKQGFKNLYIIFIATGDHCEPITKEVYQDLQSIYKLHGLPYDGTVCLKSEQELEIYKPKTMVYDASDPKIYQNNMRLMVIVVLVFLLIIFFVVTKNKENKDLDIS